MTRIMNRAADAGGDRDLVERSLEDGVIYLIENRAERAARAFEAAEAAQVPPPREAVAGLAILALRRRRWPEALSLLERHASNVSASPALGRLRNDALLG